MRLLPPDFASLTIAGDGEDRAALCQSARNIAGVQFVTGAPAFERNLAIAEAIVVPSRWQPFATQALEACAAARPLIATNIDGLDEVGNIACGEIVSPDAPSELANAIIRLAARPLRELGLAARAAAFATRDESQAQWSHLLGTVAR